MEIPRHECSKKAYFKGFYRLKVTRLDARERAWRERLEARVGIEPA
jgi:hypothetical protein